MKRILWIGILSIILSGMTLGCGPATLPVTFSGAWTTNVGKVNFQQTGNEIVGTIAGYGGFRNEPFTGTVNESGEAVFSTTWFGDFTLALTGDAFKSKSGKISFCGIRGSQELPAGCGFSGKWIVPSKSVFPDGSYAVLKQVGESVTGDLFDGANKSFDSIIGKVEWGKGWRMIGTSAQRGEVTLGINAAETGFEIVYGTDFAAQLCAVREGQPSAYISSFTCAP
jgi:hypothetical protein